MPLRSWRETFSLARIALGGGASAFLNREGACRRRLSGDGNLQTLFPKAGLVQTWYKSCLVQFYEGFQTYRLQ